ncbi:MAG TPA: transcriptional repressor [Nitrospirae bacterium]|nr:transcriptional repressor [Nitrospirota bacterium]HDO21247.1 transcriptional repressor [Nitrospirota bacterium]
MHMQRIRNMGLRLTPQRIAILEYLDGNVNHPSAEEIYNAVAKKYPTISFATVYNTLETLKRKKGILELTIDPRRRRYDPNTEPHHHIICVQCRKVADVHADFDLRLPESNVEGFKVLSKQVEFYGICPECDNQN